MANLVQNSSGLYSIRFRLGKQRFNRSLETTSEKEAKEEQARIEKTIRLVQEGEKDLPDNATPEQELEELWDCLFLRDEEVEKLLDHVRGAGAHAFIYPMFAFTAYTGARRSEIIRSEVGDFHLDEGYVLIREKKRRTDARISYRDVALHPRLKEIMAEWLNQHPARRYAFCPPFTDPLAGLGIHRDDLPQRAFVVEPVAVDRGRAPGPGLRTGPGIAVGDLPAGRAV